MQYPLSLPRIIGIVFAILIILATNDVRAHIKNEATQFPDIEFSDARFDIVVLVGAGIIPETPVFEPDKALSMHELASWAALANGLGEGGETPDVDALAASALEQGLVDELTGNASKADLNRLFFDGQLDLEDPEETPSKAEAARLIATRLDTSAGRALLDKRGIAAAAGGEIFKITTQENHHGSAYVITVGDTTHAMDPHGRVANGPTDLLQWQGKNIHRAFVRGSGEDAVWTYLEAAPPEPDTDPPAEAAEEPPPPAPPPDRTLLYILLAAVLILGIVLFYRGRRDAN